MAIRLPLTRLLTASVAALALPLALSGCASSSTVGPGSAGGTAPSSASSSSPGRTVTVDDTANRTTVTLAPGDTLQVVLHSTYWSAPVSSTPATLSPLGEPAVAPATASPGCHVPGSGCGTVAVGFRAVVNGTVRIDSTRTSCGEAKPCLPNQRDFEVTVVVQPR